MSKIYNNDKLVEKMEKYRIEQNILKADLSYRLGYRSSLLSAVYNNKANASKRLYNALAEETGIEMAYWKGELDEDRP